MKRRLGWALLIGFLLCTSSASGQPSPVEVIDRALAHFAKRTDTLLIKEDGVLLVDPKTYPIGNYRFHVDMGKCKVEDSLRDDMISRNSAQKNAADLFTTTTTVRIIAPGDVPAGTRFLGEQTPAGEPIKTIVTLAVPGYSENGQSAYVFFRFRWSMHSASASYVLDRSEKGWEVRCSDLAHSF